MPQVQVKSQPQSEPQPQPQPRPPLTLRAKLWNLAQYPLVAIAALIAAFSVQFGQLLVLMWGVWSLLRRYDPRYSFGAALFVLLTIPLFQALGRPGIADNAAIYVYELLVVGTISAVIALRKSE